MPALLFYCETCSLCCVSESRAVKVKVFCLSLKQRVSGPRVFDKQTKPGRSKRKGTNGSNPMFVTWKKIKINSKTV